MKLKSSNDFRERRIVLGLTQQQVAAQICCTSMAVSYAERGAVSKGRVVRQLSELLLRLERDDANSQ